MSMYEVRRRRGSFVEQLPGRPTFKTMEEAKSWAQDNKHLFPIGLTAIEIVEINEKGKNDNAHRT